MDDLTSDSIDVYIVANSPEELLKASILLNDLRLSGVVCDTNYFGEENDARNLIILDKDDLNRGLITVKDNITGEESKIAEDEIIEYVLGVI